LVSISVTTPPTKTAYAINEAFSSAGLVVTAAYDDASTASVTGYALSWNGSALADGNTAITAAAGAKIVAVTYKDKTANFSVIVGPTYSVSGTITTSDGAGASGASVQLTAAGMSVGSPVSAGANGAYAITGVPNGTYAIEVSLAGYDTGTIAAFTVSGANVSGKNLALQKADPGGAKTLVIRNLPADWTEVSVAFEDEATGIFVGGHAVVSGGTATIPLKTVDMSATTVIGYTLGGNWTGTGSWRVSLLDYNIFDLAVGATVAETYTAVSFSAAQTSLSYTSDFKNLRGARVGQISGSVTLTNVPADAKVFIYARVNDDDLDTSFYPVNLSTGAWIIPLYESDFKDDSPASVTGQQQVDFRLLVLLADGNDYRIENIARTLSLTSKTDIQAGNIGTKSLQTVTLSGTITVTHNGQPMPRVQISADTTGGSRLGYTQLSSPGANASWSLAVPAFNSPTDVTISVYGADSKGNQLFSQDDVKTVTGVFTTDKTGIAISLGNIRTITLSGTVTVTHNGQPVPEMYIAALTADGTWLESTSLRSPGANASWSLTMPAFDSPSAVTIRISGYDSNGNRLFDQSDNITTVTGLSTTDRSGIVISRDIRTITLSGTITVTYNGQPVPDVQIGVSTTTNGIWIGSTNLKSPGANTSWWLTMPVFDSPTDVTINIYGSDRNQYLFSRYNVRTVTGVSTTDKSGIIINLGDISP
jgi:hypothetical protein